MSKCNKCDERKKGSKALSNFIVFILVSGGLSIFLALITQYMYGISNVATELFSIVYFISFMTGLNFWFNILDRYRK